MIWLCDVTAGSRLVAARALLFSVTVCMTILPLREQSGVSLAAVSSWPGSGTVVVPVDDGGNISDAADNVVVLTVAGDVAALMVADAAEGTDEVFALTVADDAVASMTVDAEALAAADDVFALTVVKGDAVPMMPMADDDVLTLTAADDDVLTLTVADAALTTADDAVA